MAAGPRLETWPLVSVSTCRLADSKDFPSCTWGLMTVVSVVQSTWGLFESCSQLQSMRRRLLSQLCVCVCVCVCVCKYTASVCQCVCGRMRARRVCTSLFTKTMLRMPCKHKKSIFLYFFFFFTGGRDLNTSSTGSSWSEFVASADCMVWKVLTNTSQCGGWTARRSTHMPVTTVHWYLWT